MNLFNINSVGLSYLEILRYVLKVKSLIAATLIPFTDWLKNYLSLSYRKKKAMWKLRPK